MFYYVSALLVSGIVFIGMSIFIFCVTLICRGFSWLLNDPLIVVETWPTNLYFSVEVSAVLSGIMLIVLLAAAELYDSL